MLDALSKQLAHGQPLNDAQICRAVDELVDPAADPHAKADFLTALARKGETVEEIAGFVRELRALSLEPPIDAGLRDREILDVCGTGGDRLNTFNISTTVSLIVASAGVPVVKHGNRAITSQSGSADVLEALGIAIELEPARAADWLAAHHFVFFFAPKYHPAFRNIALARTICAERGQRTIFNFLGPLLNPARPSAQLVGVPQPDLCPKIAAVLQSLGIRRAMVVCGSVPGVKHPVTGAAEIRHLDELSTLGHNCVSEFYHERGLSHSFLDPASFPLQTATLEHLRGSDRNANAEIVRRLLDGRERGPRRDAVLLNCAAALFVAGKTKTMHNGWELAADLIDSGKAAAKLRDLIEATRPLARG